MVDKKDAGDLLPDDGDVLITCENGKIKKTRIVHSDEHVATLNALFELANQTAICYNYPVGMNTQHHVILNNCCAKGEPNGAVFFCKSTWRCINSGNA